MEKIRRLLAKYGHVGGIIISLLGLMYIVGPFIAPVQSDVPLRSTLVTYISSFFVIIIGFLILFGGIVLFRYPTKYNRRIQAQLAAMRAEEMRRRQNYENFLDQIAPNNWTHRMLLDIQENDAQTYLGQGNREIQAMFLNRQKEITFPESIFGNQQKYYLINIKFVPQYRENFQGDTENNSEINLNGDIYSYGDIDANGTIDGTGTINGETIKTEIPTTALLNFININTNQSFNVKILNTNTKELDQINQYFLLSDVEKHSIGLL